MINEFKSFIYYFYDRFFFNRKFINFTIKKQKFFFCTEDKTSYNWYSNFKDLAFSEIKLTKKIKTKNIKNVLFCGSHQSVIPIILSKLILSKSFFHCIEAIDYNCYIAKKNIYLNKLQKKFKLYNFAVSDKNEVLSFNSLKSNSNCTKNFFFKKKVKAKSINNFFNYIDKIDLIYLDVEGMEAKILPVLISKNLLKLKYLFIELHGDKILSQFNSNNKKIYELLYESNFHIDIMYKNKLHNFNKKKIFSDRHYLMCSR